MAGSIISPTRRWPRTRCKSRPRRPGWGPAVPTPCAAPPLRRAARRDGGSGGPEMSATHADPVKAQVAGHWDRRGAHFDEDFGHSIGSRAGRAAWDRILDLVIPAGRPIDALDAGCGT